MKRFTTALLIAACTMTLYAEYPELTELKKWSRARIEDCAFRLRSVDRKFSGVIKFGLAISDLDFSQPIDIGRITVQNDHYWRATMEMAPEDPSVLFAHGYLLILNGEVDLSDIYFHIGSLTMEEDFRLEHQGWLERRQKLQRRQEQDLAKGIALHDQKKYKKAIECYDAVLENHPCCGSAFYEKGFSYLLWGSLKKPEMEKKKEECFRLCRKHNPFMWHAYQGSDQELIRCMPIILGKIEPFASGEDRSLEAFIGYAAGCEEIGLYPVAAHSRWRLVSYDKDGQKEHIRKFVECIQKAGCPDITFFKSQFNVFDAPKQPGPTAPLPVQEEP